MTGFEIDSFEGLKVKTFNEYSEESGCTMQEAFNEVYRSKIFDKLSDPDSGLFFQSSRYVYAYLLEELRAKS